MNALYVKNSLCLTTVLFCVLLMSACDDAGTVGALKGYYYDTINPDQDDEPESTYLGVTDDDFFVKQGNSLCGPTSFYMIFKYYNDTSCEEYLSTSSECTENSLLSGISEIFTTVFSTSWVGNWLDSASDGIGCSVFLEKINNLHQCIGTTAFPFYAVLEGNCEVTEEAPDDYNAGANVIRRERFDYIVEYFLKYEFPVIIHLRRIYDDYPYLMYPGHYVVVMGFDTATREVYIMNPYQDLDDNGVMTVPYDSFIMERWYQSTGYMEALGYPDARWDGQWIGFHH